jgi:hypothetical protein
MSGWPVFALQTYLNALLGVSLSLTADGDFGPATAKATATFQKFEGLVADAIAGPATQSKLVVRRVEKVEGNLPALPGGLLHGQLLGEGGLMLAPVNALVLGGVDCGAAQYRVYGPPFAVNGEPEDGVSLRAAFDPSCVRRAADDLLSRRAVFFKVGAWSRGNSERAGRLAAFAHNWPSGGGADYYAEHGHVSNPGGICTWLPRDRNGNPIVHFPDGVLVRTRQDWAEFYAMGGAHGEGAVTRFVTSWT